MGIVEITDYIKTSSSCSGSSCSSDRRRGFSEDIYMGMRRCEHCDMGLTVEHYVVHGYSTFCDERCYRNHLITENKKMGNRYREIHTEIAQLKTNKIHTQETIDGLNLTNDELLKRNKELEKEIKIREEGIDKFMHLDLD